MDEVKDTVVGDTGETDGMAEGANTRSAEDDTAGLLVGVTPADVGVAVSSTVEVEYGTPSWST